MARARGTSASSRSARTSRRGRGRGVSTTEYGLPISRTWARANYAYPKGAGADRGKRASYPIVPKSRARAARTYASRRDTAGSRSHVDRAIRARYGSVRAIYTGPGGVRATRARSGTATRARGGARSSTTRTRARGGGHVRMARSRPRAGGF